MEVREPGIATAAVKGARGCACALAVARGSSLAQEHADLARLQSNPAAATGQCAEIERYCHTTAMPDERISRALAAPRGP